MDTSEPLVSVLMPCYNAEEYLREAINSIVTQSYKNLEILIIDDGSSDNTLGIIREFGELDKRIKVIVNSENIGLIRTLNKGISAAGGDFIARMDADDISDENRIKEIISVFRSHPELDVVAAGYYHLSADGKLKRKIYPKARTSNALWFVSFFAIPVLHPCIVARSNAMRNNLYDEAFVHSEDYELFSRMLSKGYKFYNIKEPLYYLRKNVESVSHKYEKIQISNHSRISRRNIELYFDVVFEYFLHKIMINRISFNISPILIRKAFSNLDDLRMRFIKREKCTDGEIVEINEFLVELKIDIMIQAMKHSAWMNKLDIVSLMLRNTELFICKRGIQYLRSKIWFAPSNKEND